MNGFEYPLLAFALAAVLGLTLAVSVLRGKMVRWVYSLLHAILGATGLILLFSLVVQAGSHLLALVSLALFLMAAFGGFFPLARQNSA